MFPCVMPALKNHRQERFCQLVKRGIPPYRAYPEAGYKPHEGAPYRLCGNVRVKARLRELTKGFAMKTRVTVESITREFDEARELALKVDQPGAAIAATANKAKLHGLLIDRKESGAPGDFAGLASPDEVREKIRQELGEAAVALYDAADQEEAEPAEEQPAIVPTIEGSGTLN